MQSSLPSDPRLARVARLARCNHALRQAVRHAHPHQVEQALRAGADPDAPDWSGATALHDARDRTTVRILLSAGANPAACDTAGRTPMETALSRPRRAVAGCLHAVPGAVAPDRLDRVVRHAAAAAARPVVARLLSGGVDPNAPDARGRTALHRLLAGPHALSHDGGEVARLLTAAGADWHRADARGRTPRSLVACPPAWPRPWRRLEEILARLGWTPRRVNRQHRLLALADAALSPTHNPSPTAS